MATEILFSTHALEQMREREASEEEDVAIVTAAEARGRVPNKVAGRYEAEAVVQYEGFRAGRYYARKRIWVVYEPLGDNFMVVTVVTQFGRWDDAN